MSTNTSSVRDRTRDEIYRLIRANLELTRSEIVELTGLSRSTVNHGVGRLISLGRVAEGERSLKGPGSGSGRPSLQLRAVGSENPIAGIDFGHNHVIAAIADSAGNIIGERRADLNVDMDGPNALDLAAALIDELRASHGVERLASVVAGVPGPMDVATGLVRSPTILSSWVGLSPSDELSQRIGEPVHFENDAVLGAYGEFRRGAARHFRDVLYVKASHGVGACMIIDGKPYRGAQGLAGEIGHTKIAGRAEICRCGNRGCLEAAASAAAVRELIAHSHPNMSGSELNSSVADDPTSQHILHEAGLMIGEVVADLVNFMNPQAVVVGGELGARGGPFMDGVEAAIRRHAQPASSAVLEVFGAGLGVRAEIEGALAFASERAAV